MTIYLRMSGTNNRLIWVVRSIKPLNIVSSSAFGETSMKVLFFLCFLPFFVVFFFFTPHKTEEQEAKAKGKKPKLVAMLEDKTARSNFDEL